MCELGIEYAAFNPGASFRGLHDSLVNFPAGQNVEVIPCTHEEISVAIAHGYAKASGKPMAAIVHNVVGLQHATMAIFNAWIDRVPVYVIGATGPVDSSRRRPHIEWMHTANVQGNLVRDFVKFDDQPGSAEAVGNSMLRAWRTMEGQPQGPVYVCIDAKIQEEPAPEGLSIPDVARCVTTTRMAADPVASQRIADELLAAEHPVIVVGSLGRNPEAVPALTELAELVGCPVLSTDERLSFPTMHPLNLRGAEKSQFAEADFLLVLDVWDLKGRTSEVNRTTAEVTSLLAEDVRIARIGQSDLSVRSWTQDYQSLCPVDLDVVADTSLAVPALVELVSSKLTQIQRDRATERITAAAEQHDRQLATWRKQATEEADQVPISLAYLTEQVGIRLEGHDWVLAYHSFNPWPTRLWDFHDPRQLASGSGGGGIGYGIGGTIGVALAHRGSGKVIVDLQADGDLLYSTSALWTIAKMGLPILMVMHNNRSYYNSEQHQIATARHRGRSTQRAGIGTQLDNPAVDFGTVARGFGVWSEGPITDPADLGAAIDRALKVVVEQRLPALVDVVTAPR
jgi:thiamine pyrophosphate-dependent acetolactate synthase large subunit-like protein